MDIRCRKQKCIYNDHFTCRAKGILITKAALCSQYQPDENKEQVDTTKQLFSRTPVYAPQRDSKTICIECKADCLLNKDGLCIANGITINDYRAKPYCLTFLKQ